LQYGISAHVIDDGSGALVLSENVSRFDVVVRHPAILVSKLFGTVRLRAAIYAERPPPTAEKECYD